MSPARIKFRELSEQKSLNVDNMSNYVQKKALEHASKLALWYMAKDVKARGLKNLEIMQMNDWDKNRYFM